MMKFTQLLSVLLVAAVSVVTASSVPDLFGDIRREFREEVESLLLSRQTQTKNLQTFSGALGGIKADAVSRLLSFRGEKRVDGRAEGGADL